MRPIDADALKKDLSRFYDGEVVARQLIDEQPTVDDWISIKDRLPERGTRCLIYAAQGKAHYTSIANFNGYYFGLSGRRAYWKVTHWMPLPEPPKEEKAQ